MEVEDVAFRTAAVLAVHGMIAMVAVLGICRSALQSPLFKQAMLAVMAVARALCSWTCGVEDELAVEVEKKVRKDKVTHMRQFCQAYSVFVLPICFLHMLRIAKGQAHDTLLREVSAFVFKGVTAAVLYHPKLMSWYSIDVIYGLLILAASLVLAAPAIVPGAADSGNIALLLMMNVNVIVLSFARRDAYIVVPGNTLFAFSACLAIWCHRGSCLSSPLYMMAVECACLFLVSVFSVLLGEWSRGTIYENLQAKVARQLLGAATALLRSCCDMVIQVDQEGTIIGHATELGGFLLRGPNYSLQGQKLTDLMVHEEDRQVFLASLRAHAEEGMSNAEAIHVCMRDADRTALNLQLLYFRFLHFDGTMRYTVGIRGDFPALGERRQGGELRERHQQDAPGHAAGRDEEPGALAPSPRPASLAGFSAVGSEESDVVSNLSDAMPAILVVDAGAPGFPVLECCAGFRARIGRVPPGVPLSDVLKHGTAFVRWMSNGMNRILSGMRAPAGHRLTVFMPHGQVAARCTVLKVGNFYDASIAGNGHLARGGEDLDLENAPLDPDSVRWVQLIFSDISHRIDGSRQPRWQLAASHAASADIGSARVVASASL